MTDSYNSNHRGNPVPAKGGTGGTIGGVACSEEYIEGLFENPEALFEMDHCFCVPIHTEGKPPFTEGELRQILRELAVGIYANNAFPFFSLHFRKKSADLFPVIHPVYANTLVGRVIGMLDYFMKGYLNGVVFRESFIDQWHRDPSWERKSASAWQELIDLQRYCQLNLKEEDQQYQSLRDLQEAMLTIDNEFLKEMAQHLPKKLIERLTQASSNTSEILSQFEGFKNSFRIIAKQKGFKKTGNVFEIDADFDVRYTIEPSPEYKKELAAHLRKYGELPASHQLLIVTYEWIAKKIHDHMIKLPFCRDYFSMLGVIDFFSSYFSTLKKYRKIPVLPAVKKIKTIGCLPLFPHLPLKSSTKEALRINPSKVIARLVSVHRREMKDHFSKAFNLLLQGGSSETCKRLNQEETKKLLKTITHEVEANALKLSSIPFRRFLQQPTIKDSFDHLFQKSGEEIFNQLSQLLTMLVEHYNKFPVHQRVSEDRFLDTFFTAINDVIEDKATEITNPIPYKITRLHSELSSSAVNKNIRIVGGCGLQLQAQAIQSSREAHFLLQKNWKRLQGLEPESWMPVRKINGQQAVIFRLFLDDVPSWKTDDYTWMETCYFASDAEESGDMTEKRMQIQEAMDVGSQEKFSTVVDGVDIRDLTKMHDLHGASLLCYAAKIPDPFYT